VRYISRWNHHGELECRFESYTKEEASISPTILKKKREQRRKNKKERGKEQGTRFIETREGSTCRIRFEIGDSQPFSLAVFVEVAAAIVSIHLVAFEDAAECNGEEELILVIPSALFVGDPIRQEIECDRQSLGIRIKGVSCDERTLTAVGMTKVGGEVLGSSSGGS